MSNIFDTIWGTLNDPYKDGPMALLAAHGSAVSLELGKVIEYHKDLNEADVIVSKAGNGEPARMLIQVHYQGDTPGTGEAFALFKDQLVVCAFLGGVASGFYHQGIIIGVLPTRSDRWAPRHPILAQAAEGDVLRHKIDPSRDGEGNVEIVEKDRISKVTVTAVNHEKYGSESESYGGPIKSYSEKTTADTGKAMGNIAGKIKVV